MTRLYSVFLLSALWGCSGQEDPSTSICDTQPENLSQLDGTAVRWSGVVVDASPHGMFFAGECGSSHGIPIVQLSPILSSDQFENALHKSRFRSGAMKVVLTGYVRKRGLDVTAIEQYQFEPMSKEASVAFWRDTMGMPGIGR